MSLPLLKITRCREISDLYELDDITAAAEQAAKQAKPGAAQSFVNALKIFIKGQQE